MDVVIYVADGRIHDGLDYAGRIEERLAEAGLTSTRCDLMSMPPEQVRPERGYVLTGGQTSIHSDAEWMRSAVSMTRRLVANAEREERSVVGICLGSQIIAEALRENSTVPSRTIEVGLTPVTDTEDGGREQIVPSFHYQSISPEIRTVAGVRIEWRNEHTPVQAFNYGRRVFGCQFHPELSRADVDELIDYHAHVITRWRGDLVAAHRSVDRHADALRDDLFSRTVIDRILDQRPSDR
jgi:GMP synthase-like glutamine amidotransferase